MSKVPARRIASLLSSATEMLYALGLGGQVVGVSHECDWPPEAQAKPKLTRSRIDASASSSAIDDEVKRLLAAGETLYEIDRRKLVSLAPDLIITQAQCDVCAVRYQDVLDFVGGEPSLTGVPVVPLNPLSLDDVFDDIMRVGKAAACARRAAELVASLRERVAAIQSQTKTFAAAQRPRVICIEWISPLMLAGNWVPQLIEIAGGNCPLVSPGVHSRYHAWEEVTAFDPEVLVVAACGFDLARTKRELAAIFTWPGFADLSATKAGRVFAGDGNSLFNRSGPRLVETVELLAHLFHPSRFAPPQGEGFFEQM